MKLLAKTFGANLSQIPCSAGPGPLLRCMLAQARVASHRIGEQKKTDEIGRRSMEGRLLRGTSFLDSQPQGEVQEMLSRASLAAEEDHEAGQVAAMLGPISDLEQEVQFLKKQDKAEKPGDAIDDDPDASAAEAAAKKEHASF